MPLCSQDAHRAGFCSGSLWSGPRTLGRHRTIKQFEQGKKKRTSFHFCHKIWSSSYTSQPHPIPTPPTRPPPPIWEHHLCSFQVWKPKTGASDVYLLLFMYTRVYFPAAEARRQLCAGTVFPGISRSGVEWLVEGCGSGEGGRDEQLPFDGGGRLVFLFGYLLLGVSLAPISNTISSDANHFGRYMG